MSERQQSRRDDPVLSGAIGLVWHVRRRVLPDPGRRAAVRAAVRHDPGDPRTFRAMREVADYLPDKVNFDTERAFLAVAAMMCDQPPRGRNADLAHRRKSSSHDDTPADPSASNDDADAVPVRARSLGASCAQAVRDNEHSETGMEKRLHTVCRADVANAHRQLPELVRFLRGAGVEVDWVRLILDLARWDQSRREVAARWVRDFYRAPRSQKSNNEQEIT